MSRFIDRFFDDFWGFDIYRPEVTSWTLRGRWVDPDKYDVVPKKEYAERLVRQKENQLKELEDYYEKRKKEITEEKKRLLSKNKDG